MTPTSAHPTQRPESGARTADRRAGQVMLLPKQTQGPRPPGEESLAAGRPPAAHLLVELGVQRRLHERPGLGGGGQLLLQAPRHGLLLLAPHLGLRQHVLQLLSLHLARLHQDMHFRRTAGAHQLTPADTTNNAAAWAADARLTAASANPRNQRAHPQALLELLHQLGQLLLAPAARRRAAVALAASWPHAGGQEGVAWLAAAAPH